MQWINFSKSSFKLCKVFRIKPSVVSLAVQIYLNSRKQRIQAAQLDRESPKKKLVKSHHKFKVGDK
jgi:hypothetical protein